MLSGQKYFERMVLMKKNSHRRLCSVLIVLLFVVYSIGFMSGCRSKIEEAPKPKKTVTKAGETKYPLTVTDDLGRKLNVKTEPKKIVSLAPANTEMIFALEADDKLVGVTTYCDYPEEAKKIEKIGDFASPNIERITALQPELVFVAGGIQEGLVEKLEKLGTQVFVVDPKNFSQLFSDLEKLGRILNRQKRAEAVIKDIENEKKMVEEKTRNLAKPKVFFEIYSQPLMTAGTETFIDEMITLAGGTNVGASAGKGFPQFSEEQLVQDDPEIYIAVKMSMGDPADLAKRPGYANLKAVKDGRVYVVEDNLVVRPGPRLAQGLLEVAKAIHPEVFK